MAKEYKCKQCKNKFKKGEGSFIYKADEGYCNHCITAHVDDLNHERWEFLNVFRCVMIQLIMD